MKLKLALLAAAALISTPALAQVAPPSDTLQAVVEKGIVMTVMGTEGEIEFKADGSWAGFGGAAMGTYTVDGPNLCITSDMGTACSAYPDGKKSGDSFTITLDQFGDVPVKIR